MLSDWPGEFRDRHGVRAAVVRSDGGSLEVVLGGIPHRGDSFGSLLPELQEGELTYSQDLPVTVAGRDDILPVLVTVELGRRVDGRWDRIGVRLASAHGVSSRSWPEFELALAELARQVPAGVEIATCVSCGLSDYWPGASRGLFGGLGCFRDNVSGYLAVRDKDDLLEIWDTNSGWVQETFRCHRFRRRAPGAGFRGGFPDHD
ncbi:hypothetical protein Lfu02_04100 [Longispora fulva]|uniref:Uncharacterized protein n=1 Tax=Longispora fulva TaxID=619741 RepID=A0A8J7G8M7_9ACTN|nr:DUF6304 family protein [Longispora fulva]MBG6135723.1 hypothetical protein [Longispora fulva]GIG56038.1 hypothetical protein Lfu02_04100 [Longispora fulva]